MRDVLLVSKPVVPPWNDSSKNLVRDLAGGLSRYAPIVLGRRGAPSLELECGRTEAIYAAGSGGFAPSLVDNLRVFRRLLVGRRPALWHFFFAPNPRTSGAGAFAKRTRRIPCVQTVCSAPRQEFDAGKLLFGDRTVVLSRHTERRLVNAGVPQQRLARIPAAIEQLPPPDPASCDDQRRSFGLPAGVPIVVYPGDLEFGGGARAMIRSLAAAADTEVELVMACRPKTEQARVAERELRAEASRLGVAKRVHWIGETSRIHTLLGVADVVALPSDTLYAKMDQPLVLLEAMSLMRPVLVGAGTPAEELAEGGAIVVETEPDAVTAALHGLLSDSAERDRLGRVGREYVRSVHARDSMARAYEAVYDEVLAEAG